MIRRRRPAGQIWQVLPIIRRVFASPLAWLQVQGTDCLLVLALAAGAAGLGLGLVQETARPRRIWRFEHFWQNSLLGRLQKAAPRACSCLVAYCSP